jgi:hypothetical protein
MYSLGVIAYLMFSSRKAPYGMLDLKKKYENNPKYKGYNQEDLIK